MGSKLTRQTPTNLPSTPKGNMGKLDVATNGSTVTLSTPPNLSVPCLPPPGRSRSETSTPERKPNREAVKRNLAESFPSPKRQNTGQSNGVDTEATHQIAGIEHFMNRCKIKVPIY